MSELAIETAEKSNGRLDTRLESEGAEFLVLGQLLLHKIPTYKTYTNMPGYDLVSTNPENNSSARIQVKSRWRTGANGFPISNFACEFVVVALLNRGSKDGKAKVLTPVFYVLPVEIVKALPREGQWSKVSLGGITNLEDYKEKWSLIADFLAKKPIRTVRQLLVTLYETKAALRELGVLRSERLTGELGEWLVETAYNGKRAESTTQQGWDLKLSEAGQEIRIQVKAHAKGKKNGARWTEISPDDLTHFQRLVIVVLSDDYFVKEWYDVPTPALRDKLVLSGESHVVHWDSVKTYAVDWRKLPGAASILDFERVLKTECELKNL